MDDITKFENYLSEQLKEPELKKEYDELEPEFDALQAMIDCENELNTVKENEKHLEK